MLNQELRFINNMISKNLSKKTKVDLYNLKTEIIEYLENEAKEDPNNYTDLWISNDKKTKQLVGTLIVV